MKHLYSARATDSQADEVLVQNDTDPKTGKKQVRFNIREFEDTDVEQKELSKKRLLELTNTSKLKLLFGCHKTYRLQRLWEKGSEKMQRDLDMMNFFSRFVDLNVMFDYYKAKHSDLMIRINGNRTTVINLDDKAWSEVNEFDQKSEPVKTRFDTYHGSSEEGIPQEKDDEAVADPDDIDMQAISSESSVPEQSGSIEMTESEWESGESELSEMVSGRVDLETNNGDADFDDINESPGNKSPKEKIKQNKPRHATFENVKANKKQYKKAFLKENEHLVNKLQSIQEESDDTVNESSVASKDVRPRKFIQFSPDKSKPDK